VGGDGAVAWSSPGIFRLVTAASAEPARPGDRERSETTAIIGGVWSADSKSQKPAVERLVTPVPQRQRALTDAAFAPQSCSGAVFSDVDGGNPYCAWIEQLAADEIATACEPGAPGRFCPEHPVTRGQLAMFLERSIRGTDAWRPPLGDGALFRQPPGLTAIHAVDTEGFNGGNVGQYNSITIGADGLGLISYWDTGGPLMVAHCSNVNCTEATTTSIDFVPFFGDSTSIAIGADGFGLISYYDAVHTRLTIAHCANVECTAADAITPATPSIFNLGDDSSITIGGDGLGLVSFYDAAFGRLWSGHCSNVECSNVGSHALTDVGSGGQYTSITVGPDGLGLISSYAAGGGVVVSHCNAADCAAVDLTATFDATAGVGQYTSIAIGTDGLPLISYYDAATFDLKVAHCDNISCSGGGITATTLDAAGDVGQYTSITIGADGLGLISYYDVTNGDLKIAHCANTDCTAATISKLDTAGDVGRYTSITIGADGLGLISYYDDTNGDLKVAHCSNVLCAPYFRRR
jgi:hypothetical protein